jgi:hypothetical protein
MKTILILAMLVGGVDSFAAKETGNGGNSCSQTAARLSGPTGELAKVLRQSCAHEDGLYEIFHCGHYPLPKKYFESRDGVGQYLSFQAIQWFMLLTKVDVVPKVIVNGQETEASNDPKDKKINLSRELWCPLDDESKMKVLFHEYLGVMELESDNDYPISKNFYIPKDSNK